MKGCWCCGVDATLTRRFAPGAEKNKKNGRCVVDEFLQLREERVAFTHWSMRYVMFVRPSVIVA